MRYIKLFGSHVVRDSGKRFPPQKDVDATRDLLEPTPIPSASVTDPPWPPLNRLNAQTQTVLTSPFGERTAKAVKVSLLSAALLLAYAAAAWFWSCLTSPLTAENFVVSAIAAILAFGAVLGSIMHFQFHVQVKSWSMRIVAIIVFCAAWAAVFLGTTDIVLEIYDLLGQRYGGISDWLFSGLGLAVGVVLSYASSLLASYSLLLVDHFRVRVNNLWEGWGISFSPSLWTRFNSHFSPVTLMVSPMVLFAVATVLVDLAGRQLDHSAISVEGTNNQRELIELVHPHYFSLNQSSVVSLKASVRYQTLPLSCSLDAPNFEVTAMPLDPARQEFHIDGQTKPMPGCLWLVTARHIGDQKAVLRLTFPRTEPMSGTELDNVTPNEIVDVETLHVSGTIFTFSNLFALSGLAVIIAGFSGLVRRGN